MYGNGLNSHFFGSLHHPTCNLTTIGNEDLVEGGFIWFDGVGGVDRTQPHASQSGCGEPLIKMKNGK